MKKGKSEHTSTSQISKAAAVPDVQKQESDIPSPDALPPISPEYGLPPLPPLAPNYFGDEYNFGDPSSQINWFGMSQPFFNRGVPHLRMGENSGVYEQWMQTYQMGQYLGLGADTSSWLSNTLTPTAINSALKGDYPTMGEQISYELGSSPIMLPIPGVHFKLKVGEPDDPFEREADDMADRVMKMAKPSAQRKCKECKEEDKLQAKPQVQLTHRMSTGSHETAPWLATRLQSNQSQGRSLDGESRSFMEKGFGADFESVKIHTGTEAVQMNKDLGARAFTLGSDIYFNEGEYQPGNPEGKHLLAHELTHTLQQVGSTAPDIQRDPDESHLDTLNEMLNRWNVPEEEVIALLGQLSPAEKMTVIAGYKNRIASALNIGEMVRAVTQLGPPLAVKLDWVNAAAFTTSQIDYSDISAMLIAASQPERDALKTEVWKSFFVSVCTNTTMVSALNALNFDLQTKLRWLQAEMSITSLELGYSTIKPWITAAPQPQRDLLKTRAWKAFFVEVCSNTSMIEALNDLQFDLATKLEWLQAELNIIRMELDYATIKAWIIAAPQAQRDALKTDTWKNFFVQVCTNLSMVEALQDLGYDLKTQLQWAMAEGCTYANFKTIIGRASAADKTMVLGDTAFLRTILAYFWFWNDFAKTTELLGRALPSGGTLIGNGTVQAALSAAWTASNPAIVPRGGPVPAGVHEEGGFIYKNIVTDNLSTDRVTAGAQASLPLNNPNAPDESILVGGYHTHPNVGPAWGAPFASGADTNWATRNGIPLLFRGAFPAVANVSDGSTGPTRLHVAGNRNFPGASGGVAPQAPKDGEFDDL